MFQGSIFVLSEGGKESPDNMFNPLIYCFMIRYKIYQNQQQKGLNAGKVVRPCGKRRNV